MHLKNDRSAPENRRGIEGGLQELCPLASETMLLNEFLKEHKKATGSASGR